MNILTLNQKEIDQISGGKRTYPSVACFLIVNETKTVLASFYYPSPPTRGEYKKTRYLPKEYYSMKYHEYPDSVYRCVDNVEPGEWNDKDFMDKRVFNR